MDTRIDIIAGRVSKVVNAASKGTLDSRRDGGYYRTLLGGELSVFIREAKQRRLMLEKDLLSALASLSVGDDELSNCCGAPRMSPESDICRDCREHADFVNEGWEDVKVKIGDIRVFGFSQGPGIEMNFTLDGLDTDQVWAVLKVMQKDGYRIK